MTDTANNDLLLSDLTAANDVASSVRLVEQLLHSKRVSDLRESASFNGWIESSARIFAAASPEERLSLLAAMYRLGASSKPVMDLVEKAFDPLLEEALPPIEKLASGDDRFYVSLAVTRKRQPWSAAYAAHAIAVEDAGEKARKNFSDGLASWVDLSSLIDGIARELRGVTFGTEKPGESAAKRLTRVIAALRPAVIAVPMEPGDNLGLSLEALFRAALDVAPLDEGSAASKKAASECCGLVYDVLRTQIEVIADAPIYRSLEQVARWTSPSLWPRFVRMDPNAALVLRSLERAIVLLARRGTTDLALLGLLQFFLGPREAAAKRAAEIADSRPDIPADVRDWLARFGRTREGGRLSSMEEARDVGTDPAIAAALVYVWEIRRQLAALPQSTKPPGLDRLMSSIEHLAKSRGLSLRLEPGEEVEYSGRAHELVGGTDLGVRNVVVVVPLVERTSSGGVPAVVRRAVVEAR